MSLRKGYTLVELLIIISITAILMTFIFSGYTRAQIRQAKEQTKEALLSNLQKYQKSVYVGDKDCGGTLLGVQVSFTASTITATPICSGTPNTGTAETYTCEHCTFSPIPSTFTFRPLEQGISFQSGTSQNIDYLIADKTYRITIENPGTITYLGQVTP